MISKRLFFFLLPGVVLLILFMFVKSPTRVSFQRIKAGMKPDKVKEIFGRAPDFVSFGIGARNNHQYIDSLAWHDLDGSVAWIDFEGDCEERVRVTRWKDPTETIFQRFLHLLH